ncbi:MAG: glycosyltransferase [Prevotellaceae bacterium]|nr:glycosyltransferase [Prevotellaceae bacterium]
MINILFVAPISGNGGIQSWVKKFLVKFSSEDIHIDHQDVSQRRSSYTGWSIRKRTIDGFKDLFDIKKIVDDIFSEKHYDILYTTTSGSIGSLRDIILGRIARKHKVKTILHCHYGCLIGNYHDKGVVGWLLRKSLRYYDQIWVLDRKTLDFLNGMSEYSGRVFLTPNFIDVPDTFNPSPKEYRKVAYVGNLLHEKGLFDTIKAVKTPGCNVEFDIVGPGTDDVKSEMMNAIGAELNKKIKVLGKLPNHEAVEFMKTVDIIALPTYFHSEAFPISILEAMSLGKFIISTRRAAIPDMLTDLDGNDCGYFVREQNSDDIIEAIKWCQENKDAADIRCKKAYEKVKACYDTHIVMDIYKSLFRDLVS